MNDGPTLTFDLPRGWTLRKVATAMAREWLPPFRAVPVAKRAPWMVQPIVEESGAGGSPLWEPGISTEEYQQRLDRASLSWSIRAKAGRGVGTVLARLAMRHDDPTRFELVCTQESFPETLFDSTKMDTFLAAQKTTMADGLFACLLIENGFPLASA